jgi:hypothetical protein
LVRQDRRHISVIPWLPPTDSAALYVVIHKIPHYVEGRGLGGRVKGSLAEQCLDIRDVCRLLHCTENAKHIFPEIKLHGLVPNFHTHVFVDDLYLSRDRSTYFATANRWTDRIILLLCYSSVLEITRPHSFISGNTRIGPRHFYWILTGHSFAVYAEQRKQNIGKGMSLKHSHN